MKATNVLLVMIPVFMYLGSCNNTSGSQLASEGNTNPKAHEHKPIAASDSVQYVSKTVEVKGNVQNELRLTVDSLKNMKTITLDEFNVVCQSGATVKADKTSKGVLLKVVLEKAGIKQLNHKDRNFIIVARATDDYLAAFSWGEIFNNPTGNSTYILFEENGKPIMNHGEMILICTNDIKTGPRHVNWLKSIEVTRID